MFAAQPQFAIVDQELGHSEQVNLVTQSCYYQLRQLHAVMHSLSRDAAVVLVHRLFHLQN